MSTNNKSTNKFENDDIYYDIILKHRLILSSKFFTKDIDNYILNYLKNELEGKCVYEGFIKKDSLSIIKRSSGLITGSRFTGDITIDTLLNAKICNPQQGNLIDCKIKFINKLGILGYNGPLTIIVSKQLSNNIENFQNYKEGDIIKVEIIAKKFLLNDKEIQIVGKLFNKNVNKKLNKKIDVVEDKVIKSDKENIIDDNIDLDIIDEQSNIDINDDNTEITEDLEEDIKDIDELDDEDLDEDFIDDEEDDENENKNKIKMINFDDEETEMSDIDEFEVSDDEENEDDSENDE